MGDIAIAGTTTDELVHLPTDEGGLIEFLGDSSLAVIWNYIVGIIILVLFFHSLYIPDLPSLFYIETVDRVRDQCVADSDHETTKPDANSQEKHGGQPLSHIHSSAT